MGLTYHKNSKMIKVVIDWENAAFQAAFFVIEFLVIDWEF